MTTMDKAAIGWSIGIVAVGVMFAFYGQSVQDAGTSMFAAPSSPTSAPVTETEPKTDPFAEKAAQIMAQKEREAAMAEQKAMTEEKPTAKSEEKPATKAEEKPMPKGPQTVNVEIPSGTSVPGCEETNECFVPASVTINVGDTVIWTNGDTAAHTVTSGSPADGPDGKFDSSLILGGASYENTFDKAGSYDYFCMVHPWMVGNVQVN